MKKKTVRRIAKKPGGFKAELEGRNAQIIKLKAAIQWALGEASDHNGDWFGQKKPDHAPPYWWRSTLRSLAGM